LGYNFIFKSRGFKIRNNEMRNYALSGKQRLEGDGKPLSPIWTVTCLAKSPAISFFFLAVVDFAGAFVSVAVVFSVVFDDASLSFCFPNICSIPDFGFAASGSGLGFTTGFFSSLTATSGSDVRFEARGVARLLTMPLNAVVGLNSFLGSM
jgi:hypothetical protein